MRTTNELLTGAVVVMAFVISMVPGIPALELALGGLVVGAILTAWPWLGRGARMGAAGSLVMGLLLGLPAGATFGDMAAGLSQMATVFGFFVLVRLLEVPILAGRFPHAIVRFFAERARIRNRAAAGTLVTFALTSGLSIGAVPIAYRFSEALWSGTGREDTQGMGRIVAQGFSAANAWTPVSPIVALALQITGARVVSVLAWAVPMAVAAAAASMWQGRRSGILPRHLTPVASRGAGEFAFAITALILAIALVEEFVGVTPIGASMIGILVVVTAWQLTLQRPGAALGSLWRAVKDQRGSWPEQCTLFCAGGLLVGVARAVTRGWVGGGAATSGLTLVIVLAVPLAIVLLAGLSLYPLVSLAALGGMLESQLGADAATALALALIVGATIAFLVSPFTGLSLLVSSMSRRSSYEVAVRWNLGYGLACLASGTALVAVAYGLR